jgi:hypothetical protein
MSIMASIKNVLCQRKVEQTKQNAGQTVQKRSIFKHALALPMAFAAAFVVMLSSLAGPASAAAFDINGTVGPILEGVAALIPTIVNLIIAVVPAIIVLAVVGFIVTFLDKILAMLHLK